MFHILIAEEAVTALNLDEELDAVADETFSRRSNHWIFSEEWYVWAAYAHGANITAARFNTPLLNAYGIRRLWPVERDADVPDDAQINDWRDDAWMIPRDEEIAVATSNDLGASTEQHEVVLWISPRDRMTGRSLIRTLPEGIQQSPMGQIRQKVRFTITQTSVATAWAQFGAITFEQTLRRGTYCVVGCQVFAVAPLAYRLNFPRSPMQQGRKLYPGGLCQQAIGEKPNPIFSGGCGPWGYFASDELPTLSLYSVGAASEACVGYMDLVYVSESTEGFRHSA